MSTLLTAHEARCRATLSTDDAWKIIGELDSLIRDWSAAEGKAIEYNARADAATVSSVLRVLSEHGYTAVANPVPHAEGFWTFRAEWGAA